MKADWVSGDDKDRDGKIGRQVGRDSGLGNCALLTEGFDHRRPPRSSYVAHEKPFALCSDGRSGPGSRRENPDCLIVDFNFLTAKHTTSFDRLTCSRS